MQLNFEQQLCLLCGSARVTALAPGFVTGCKRLVAGSGLVYITCGYVVLLWIKN